MTASPRREPHPSQYDYVHVYAYVLKGLGLGLILAHLSFFFFSKEKSQPSTAGWEGRCKAGNESRRSQLLVLRPGSFCAVGPLTIQGPREQWPQQGRWLDILIEDTALSATLSRYNLLRTQKKLQAFLFQPKQVSCRYIELFLQCTVYLKAMSHVWRET